MNEKDLNKIKTITAQMEYHTVELGRHLNNQDVLEVAKSNLLIKELAGEINKVCLNLISPS